MITQQENVAAEIAICRIRCLAVAVAVAQAVTVVAGKTALVVAFSGWDKGKARLAFELLVVTDRKNQKNALAATTNATEVVWAEDWQASCPSQSNFAATIAIVIRACLAEISN